MATTMPRGNSLLSGLKMFESVLTAAFCTFAETALEAELVLEPVGALDAEAEAVMRF